MAHFPEVESLMPSLEPKRCCDHDSRLARPAQVLYSGVPLTGQQSNVCGWVRAMRDQKQAAGGEP